MSSSSTPARRRVIAQKNKELEALSNKLSKYLSPQIYHSIFTGAQNVEIASNRKKLTIFFSDVVNFTETTDKLESEDLTNLLNRYLTEMSDIALAHGATIDKYIGDAIMVFFGDPETKGVKEDARACVRMAVAMLRRLRELQAEWQELGAEKPFHLRIGINTGYVTVGNFGSDDRMDYTIIGSAVNLTARLQSHSEIDGILLGPRDLFAGEGRGRGGGADADQGEGLRRAGPLLQGARALRRPRRGRQRDPRGAGGVQIPPQPAKARQKGCYPHSRRHSIAPQVLNRSARHRVDGTINAASLGLKHPR